MSEKSIMSPEEEAFLKPIMKESIGLALEEEDDDFEEDWACFKELLSMEEKKT